MQNSDTVSVYEDPRPVATAPEFERALLALLAAGRLSPIRLALLTAHLRAPDRTISTYQLAKKLSLRSFRVANLLYGSLAHEIADILHIDLPQTPSGDPHWWRMLAYGDEDSEVGPDHYNWIMRPELAEALEKTVLVLTHPRTTHSPRNLRWATARDFVATR